MSQKNNGKILFFKESTFKVAELIFNYPTTTFHVRKIADKTALSTTAVTRAIDELQMFKIVEVEKTEITKNVRSNIDTQEYRFYKKIFNLYRLERYGLIAELRDVFMPKTIVLFGSFARGEDIEKSDIDILIVTERRGNIEEIDVLEKMLNRKINIVILPSLEDSKDEFKNAVANGIVLHGYLKVV